MVSVSEHRYDTVISYRIYLTFNLSRLTFAATAHRCSGASPSISCQSKAGPCMRHGCSIMASTSSLLFAAAAWRICSSLAQVVRRGSVHPTVSPLVLTGDDCSSCFCDELRMAKHARSMATPCRRLRARRPIHRNYSGMLVGARPRGVRNPSFARRCIAVTA